MALHAGQFERERNEDNAWVTEIARQLHIRDVFRDDRIIDVFGVFGCPARDLLDLHVRMHIHVGAEDGR